MERKLESKFQSELKKKIQQRLPGSMVMKLDSSYIQGIPDLLVLHEGHWATLECKRYSGASHRPNQDYYVDKMNDMSFSRFISPDNEEEVLDELCKAFES
ncbi:MAG: hypothetical protein MJZ20_01625 [Bacteroidaceae bacterium]|nr:hypothetical protein [Bacteroidaceae bacterium]